MKKTLSQKLISYKIDLDLLDQIDSYCLVHGVKKNAVINMYLRIGLSNLSTYMVARLVADHCSEYGFDWKSYLVNGSLEF